MSWRQFVARAFFLALVVAIMGAAMVDVAHTRGWLVAALQVSATLGVLAGIFWSALNA